jgi:hypothetical protein
MQGNLIHFQFRLGQRSNNQNNQAIVAVASRLSALAKEKKLPNESSHSLLVKECTCLQY